jgi:antitoxin (DNA-binding transcriptional repressor) of toxin-antitoxin stability system
MTVQMSIAKAEPKLSALVIAAEEGADVILARDGLPVVRLASVVRRPFQIGLLDGMGGGLPDFLEPMTESDLRDWA